jgi:hypothetical protein
MRVMKKSSNSALYVLHARAVSWATEEGQDTHPSKVNLAVFAAAASALVHVAPGAAFAPAFRPSHGCVPPAAVVTFCGRARTGPS